MVYVCVCVCVCVQMFIWVMESGRDSDVNGLDEMLSSVTADVAQLPRLSSFPLGEPFFPAVLTLSLLHGETFSKQTLTLRSECKMFLCQC